MCVCSRACMCVCVCWLISLCTAPYSVSNEKQQLWQQTHSTTFATRLTWPRHSWSWLKLLWVWPTGWPYRKFGYVGYVRLSSCLFVSGLIALSVSKLAERKRSWSRCRSRVKVEAFKSCHTAAPTLLAVEKRVAPKTGQKAVNQELIILNELPDNLHISIINLQYGKRLAESGRKEWKKWAKSRRKR